MNLDVFQQVASQHPWPQIAGFAAKSQLTCDRIWSFYAARSSYIASSTVFPGHSDWAENCLTLARGIGQMPLVNLVVALIVVGVLLYLINRYIPMASSIKTILNAVVVVAVVVWVLQVTGLWSGISTFKVRG